jgi:hypothetical protein
MDDLNHRKDLSSYLYGMTFTIHEVKNIGWIDKHHEFKTGAVQSIFLKKLRELIFNSYKGSCNILVDELRGSYDCPVCEKHDLRISNENDYFILGSAELWIPNNKAEGNYFAAFGLIIHYIEDHHYQPPQDFIDAVLALDMNSIFNGQDVQDRLVRKCAGRE